MSADLRVPRATLEALTDPHKSWRWNPHSFTRECRYCGIIKLDSLSFEQLETLHEPKCPAAAAGQILKGTQWDDLHKQARALGERLPRGFTGRERIYMHPEDIKEVELLLFRSSQPPFVYRPMMFMGIKVVSLPWIGPPIVAPALEDEPE